MNRREALEFVENLCGFDLPDMNRYDFVSAKAGLGDMVDLSIHFRGHKRFLRGPQINAISVELLVCGVDGAARGHGLYIPLNQKGDVVFGYDTAVSANGWHTPTMFDSADQPQARLQAEAYIRQWVSEAAPKPVEARLWDQPKKALRA